MQDYGPKVNFKKKKLKSNNFTGLPSCGKLVYDRMKALNELNNFFPVELCNLEYTPERGSAIDPHFDDFWLWGERLVTLNLLSETVLCFTRDEKPEVEIDVRLAQRSLIVVSGEARNDWKHGIPRDKISSRRLAMTFRELTEEFEFSELGQTLIQTALLFTGQSVGSQSQDNGRVP